MSNTPVMPEKKLHRFTHNHINSTYFFKNGKAAHFLGGIYLTDVKEEAEELINEIRLGHPNIGQDAGKEVITESDLDPLKAVREKAVADYVAAQTAAVNPKNDMGKTENASGFTGATSAGVSGAAAASDSGSPAAVVSAPPNAPNTARTVNLGSLAGLKK